MELHRSPSVGLMTVWSILLPFAFRVDTPASGLTRPTEGIATEQSSRWSPAYPPSNKLARALCSECSQKNKWCPSELLQKVGFVTVEGPSPMIVGDEVYVRYFQGRGGPLWRFERILISYQDNKALIDNHDLCEDIMEMMWLSVDYLFHDRRYVYFELGFDSTYLFTYQSSPNCLSGMIDELRHEIKNYPKNVIISAFDRENKTFKLIKLKNNINNRLTSWLIAPDQENGFYYLSQGEVGYAWFSDGYINQRLIGEIDKSIKPERIIYEPVSKSLFIIAHGDKIYQFATQTGQLQPIPAPPMAPGMTIISIAVTNNRLHFLAQKLNYSSAFPGLEDACIFSWDVRYKRWTKLDDPDVEIPYDPYGAIFKENPFYAPYANIIGVGNVLIIYGGIYMSEMTEIVPLIYCFSD